MAAGTRRIYTSHGAAATTENILANSPLEYPGVASTIEVAAVANFGLNPEDNLMDVIIGTDLIAEAIVLPIADAADRGPKLPDHILVSDVVAPSDHVQIRIRSAAAGEFISLVRIQPI
jgi:hypothetical protein